MFNRGKPSLTRQFAFNLSQLKKAQIYPETISSWELSIMAMKLHYLDLNDEMAIESDIPERIELYSLYELKKIPISMLNLDSAFDYDEEKELEFIEKIKKFPNYPPIIINEYYEIIDGYHRANAIAKLGSQEILAYVPVIKNKNSFNLSRLKKAQTENPPNSYPSISWIRQQLRWNPYSSARYKILSAYVIGSEAKGTANPDSDLDIAVVIAPAMKSTALNRTERYHQKFTDNSQMPVWNNRRVDFQFFYPDDPELETYSKIEIYN